MGEKDKMLAQEALKLRDEGKYDEALALMDLCLEYNPDNYNYWNVKAMILDGLGKFESSQEFYLKAYELSGMKVILQNRARSLFKWARKLHFPDAEYEKALEIINLALEISPREREYWFLKGEIYEGMGNLIEARKAFYRAQDEDEKLDELEYELDLFDIYSKGRIINITGTGFYKGLEPFAAGTVVDLVREPENEHDSDAVRVEIDGETVGYVSNSDYTSIDGVLRAGELGEDDVKAEVMMIYLNELVIARLL